MDMKGVSECLHWPIQGTLYVVAFRVSMFSSVQSLSHVQLFVTPWIAARQASLSISLLFSNVTLVNYPPLASGLPQWLAYN